MNLNPLNLFKRKQKPSFDQVKAKFKNMLGVKYGFTEESLEKLFMVHYHLLVDTKSVDDCANIMAKLSFSDGVLRLGKKQAAFAAYCLYLSHRLVSTGHPSVYGDIKSHQQISLVAAFYNLISSEQKGYSWLCNNDEIMHHCWLYLRSSKGLFAPVFNSEILHVEDTDSSIDEADDDISAADLDGIVALSTGSINSVPAPLETVAAIPDGESSSNILDSVAPIPSDPAEFLSGLVAANGLDNLNFKADVTEPAVEQGGGVDSKNNEDLIGKYFE